MAQSLYESIYSEKSPCKKRKRTTIKRPMYKMCGKHGIRSYTQTLDLTKALMGNSKVSIPHYRHGLDTFSICSLVSHSFNRGFVPSQLLSSPQEYQHRAWRRRTLQDMPMSLRHLPQQEDLPDTTEIRFNRGGNG